MTGTLHEITDRHIHSGTQQNKPQNAWQVIRAAAAVFVTLSLITGVIYPLIVTLAAQSLFPWRANGSLMDTSGRPTADATAAVGSELIGQNFTNPISFWPRPSATSPVPYTAYNADKGTGSGGSNQSPAGQAFAEAVQARVSALRAADPENTAAIPIDLVTASGSGLDPHESIAAARYQAHRIAKARGVTIEQIKQLIDQYTQQRALGVLGEPTVNVLKLNLALDAAYPRQASK